MSPNAKPFWLLGALSVVGCRGADRTEVRLPLRDSPPGAEAPLDASSPGQISSSDWVDAGATAPVDAAATGPGSALDASPRLEAGPPLRVMDAAPPPVAEPGRPVPCELQLTWLESSPCEPLSAAPRVTRALWNGQSLSLLGGGFGTSEGFERVRSCQFEPPCEDPNESCPSVQPWRFYERFEFAESLPSDSCPSQPVALTYHYDECPLVGPVCYLETTACTFDVTLTAVGVASSPEAGAFEAAPEEETCEPIPVGTQQISALVPSGGECRASVECVAGHFCSRELEGDTCSLPATGRCLLAPRLDECALTREADLCFCNGRPLPPSLPGGVASNRCSLNALGQSVIACSP